MAKDPPVLDEDFDSALGEALRCCDTPTILRDGPTVQTAEVVALAKDLGTLLHSHCTKLSLAARPPRTDAAVEASMTELYRLLPAFTSLVLSVQNDTMGSALCDVIRAQTRYALLGLRALVQAGRSDAVDQGRLEKTGILWDSCLELQRIESLSVLMSNKVKECRLMIQDAVDDLTSWMEGESDDNFQEFEDSASESDSEEDSEETRKGARSGEEVERRVPMLSRIILLLKAIDKRRITAQSGTVLMNGIYDNIVKLAVEVDDLAGEIQESSDPAFVMEMEKAVVHRVEELLDVTVAKNTDVRWQEWVTNFRNKWLQEVKTDGA